MESPRFRPWLVIVFIVGLLPLRLSATSVIPPNFDSLVSQADYVVRAVVTSVAPEWRVDGANRHIISKVTLQVKEVIKGTPPSPLVLEMLGGRIGTTELEVEGAPKFVAGEEDVFFVHGNRKQIIPLVGIMYGVFPVSHDAKSGQDFILRSNGMPLYDVKDVTQPMTPAVASARTATRPLTANEFANQVRASFYGIKVPPPANAN